MTNSERSLTISELNQILVNFYTHQMKHDQAEDLTENDILLTSDLHEKLKYAEYRLHKAEEHIAELNKELQMYKDKERAVNECKNKFKSIGSSFNHFFEDTATLNVNLTNLSNVNQMTPTMNIAALEKLNEIADSSFSNGASFSQEFGGKDVNECTSIEVSEPSCVTPSQLGAFNGISSEILNIAENIPTLSKLVTSIYMPINVSSVSNASLRLSTDCSGQGSATTSFMH